MIDNSEVQVLFPAWWRRRDSEAQGRRREAGSERSVEQTREPMKKNRIRGVSAGRAGKWPRSPGPSKARSVNSAVARGKWSVLPREICAASWNQDWGEPRGRWSRRRGQQRA